MTPQSVFNSVGNYRFHITYLFLNVLALYLKKLQLMQILESGKYDYNFLQLALNFREACFYILMFVALYIGFLLKTKPKKLELTIILLIPLLFVIYEFYSLVSM